MKLYSAIQKVSQEGVSKNNILELQIGLKLLGFMPRNYKKQCDGVYGNTTNLAVRALQAYLGMARGNYDITNEINKCLIKQNWLKVPFVENPDEENKRIREFLDSQRDNIIKTYGIPYPFLKAIFWQETGLKHYDDDGFLFIGCDFGILYPEEYRSRGWGIGQYTIKNHPPTVKQYEDIIDPMKNIQYCIRILKNKFQLYCKNKIICKYKIGDENYLRDCFKCLDNSSKCKVVYPEANYHPKAQRGYDDIPFLSDCGWGIAVERYNGVGQNAMAYRDEVLMKVLGKEIR